MALLSADFHQNQMVYRAFVSETETKLMGPAPYLRSALRLNEVFFGQHFTLASGFHRNQLGRFCTILLKGKETSICKNKRNRNQCCCNKVLLKHSSYQNETKKKKQVQFWKSAIIINYYLLL